MIYSLIVFTDFDSNPKFALEKGDFSKYNNLYINSVELEESGLQEELDNFLFDRSGILYSNFTTAVPLSDIYRLMAANAISPQYEIIQVNTGIIP